MGFEAQGGANAGVWAMNRTPVLVTLGMTAIDGDMPITCVPLEGGFPVYCYATAEQVEQFTRSDSMAWFAEWNGTSFDLIEPMTDAEVRDARLIDVECPF